MNSFEVARSFLSHEKLLLDKLLEHSKQNESGIYYVIPPYIMANAFAGIVLTFCLIVYHRILEIKNLPSEWFFLFLISEIIDSMSLKFCMYIELLWCSLVVEVASLLCRIYQVYEITAEYSLFDLEPSIQFLTTACFGFLVLLDGICIHKVVSWWFVKYIFFREF